MRHTPQQHQAVDDRLWFPVKDPQAPASRTKLGVQILVYQFFLFVLHCILYIYGLLEQGTHLQ
jgi:hypothetical protein